MATDAPELRVQLRQLAYLAEIARSETWTEAARQLGISQPALSQSMHELERRWEAHLFEAAGRRRLLTPEGEQAVAYAREILDRTEDLLSRLHATGDELQGRLRVGMIDAASLYVLPEALRAFRARFPRVDLELTVSPSSSLLEGLSAFEYDLVFVTGPVDERGLLVEPIREEPLYLYGPESGDPVTGDWVLYPSTSRTRRLIDAFCAEVGWSPHVILESANPAVLRQMVGLGFGWAILPEAVAEENGGGLRKQRTAPVATRWLVSAWRAGSDANPRVTAFRSVIGEWVGGAND